MGYFSNGTEGEMFVDSYCSRCVNWRDLDDGRGFGCPVYDVHLIFAYEETGTGSNAESILDLLIPRKVIQASDGYDLPVNECAMFVEAS